MGATRYTEQEIEAGLSALVLTSGNSRRATTLLREAGKRAVPHRTLHDWRTNLHADRYRALQEELRPVVNAKLAEDHEALVQAYTEIQWKALEVVEAKLPEAKAYEASNIAKNAAIATGIHTEKAQLRRGEPTQIRQNESIPELLRRLVTKWPGIAEVNPALIEGEAKELESA